MRIGVIQASSQKSKNETLYRCTLRAVEHNGRHDTVVNYGVFPNEEASFSYIETALDISLLLCSGAVDFIVTGCSSGQGMMLACNSLPGVLCGFVQTPQDAYLFGRINGGNAASLPLGLNYGWLGEINMQCTLDKLFDGAFGCGYPPEEAERKRRDAEELKRISAVTKRTLPEVLALYDPALVQKALCRKAVRDDIQDHGKHPEIAALFMKQEMDNDELQDH
ncbi:MAG: RpiB/LacA/LacB family sugar-phosphate isomerase [Clostridia bacterium]|nr:RpiB/LacA/LacB family sugar-phosphate isomerase [Clostridia bacterium]